MMFLCHYEHKHGLRSSILAFSFWMILTTTMLIQLITHALNFNNNVTLNTQ